VKGLKIRRRPVVAVRAYKQRVSDDLTVVEWADGSTAGELTLTEAMASKLAMDLTAAIVDRRKWREAQDRRKQAPLPGNGHVPHEADVQLPLHDHEHVVPEWIREHGVILFDEEPPPNVIRALADGRLSWQTGVAGLPLGPRRELVMDPVTKGIGYAKDPVADRPGGGSEPS
jgi:hypothetical protein